MYFRYVRLVLIALAIAVSLPLTLLATLLIPGFGRVFCSWMDGLVREGEALSREFDSAKSRR